MKRAVLLVGLVGGACHHDTGPAKKAEPAVASVEADWKIVGHVITPTAQIDEKDAVVFNGRSIKIPHGGGYSSPFEGTCEQASRIRRTRDITDILDDANVPHAAAAEYDLTNPITDWKLSCREVTRPPLQIFVSGTDKAMTCFSGVCYFLRR